MFTGVPKTLEYRLKSFVFCERYHSFHMSSRHSLYKMFVATVVAATRNSHDPKFRLSENYSGKFPGNTRLLVKNLRFRETLMGKHKPTHIYTHTFKSHAEHSQQLSRSPHSTFPRNFDSPGPRTFSLDHQGYRGPPLMIESNTWSRERISTMKFGNYVLANNNNYDTPSQLLFRHRMGTFLPCGPAFLCSAPYKENLSH